MKKIITFALFFTALPFLLRAQEDFRFGIQVSPTISWLQSSDKKINSNGTNLGVKLGMLGEFYFAENYAILGGLGLTFNHGGTLKHDEGGNFWPNSNLSEDEFYEMPDGINVGYHIQYLEIPLALRMRTREFGYLRYFAEIPRFLFSVRTRARGDLEGGLNTEDETINEDVNPLSVSWGVGAGIEYSVSPNTALVAGIFYQSSFLDVTRDKGAQKYDYNEGGGFTVIEDENSQGVINALTLRLGVMF